MQFRSYVFALEQSQNTHTCREMFCKNSEIVFIPKHVNLLKKQKFKIFTIPIVSSYTEYRRKQNGISLQNEKMIIFMAILTEIQRGEILQFY